jgi:hypothetical protein
MKREPMRVVDKTKGPYDTQEDENAKAEEGRK